MSTRNNSNTPALFVVSDLHLAAERGHGLFQAEEELAAFFDWIVERAPHSTLVLAGDILDFLVPETAEATVTAFAPERAPEQARAISQAHQKVFAALARLAHSPEHHLFWLGGNHDPELALPEVRQALEQALDDAPIKWRVHGEGVKLQVGAARVVIEHGDLYDSWNRINHRALLQTVSLFNRGLPHAGLTEEYRFEPPPGSQLVAAHLSAIRRQHPWVEWLKPEWRAVVPVLATVLPFEQQAAVLKLGRRWRELVKTSVVTEIRSKSETTPLPRDRKAAAPPADELTDYFLKWLDEAEQPAPRGPVREAVDRLLLKGLQQVARLDKSFDLTASEGASKDQDLLFLLRQGVDLIVHGHTHAAKGYCLNGGQGLYLNTGTWGRLLQLPPHDAGKAKWQDFLSKLRAGEQRGFLLPTFVQITEDAAADCVVAALQCWGVSKSATGESETSEPAAGEPATLARWRFTTHVSQWVREG